MSCFQWFVVISIACLRSQNLIPSKMTEKIIYRTSYILISNCYDGPNDENPTCGWRYAHTGQKIANSQVKV